MATYSASDLTTKPVHTAEFGNASVYIGTNAASGTNVATGDKIRLCKVPAGFRAHKFTVVNTSFGTTVPATVQFEPLDGSTATTFGTTDMLSLQTASASGTDYSKAPVAVTKDSYLTLLLGTVSSGNGTGVATGIIEGEFLGAA